MSRPAVVSSATLSIAAHGLALAIVAITLTHKPQSSESGSETKAFSRLVYVASGAGGGKPVGTKNEELRTKTEERRTTNKEWSPERIVRPEPAVVDGLHDAIGAMTAVPSPDPGLRGPGSGLTAGPGRGSHSGDGNRHGSGPGDEDGLSAGDGVSLPRLIREVKPNYTVAAMRAQIEGMVELEIVVLTDGSVGRVRVVRSLDSRFGLDEQAIEAVRRWRFEPGRQFGKAVPVRVGVEMSFHLR